MHIGGMLIFDALPNGKPPTLDAPSPSRRPAARRPAALPPRLSRRRGPAALHRPRWEPDERFDVATHVTRAALPAPGGERELLDWAGDFWSHRVVAPGRCGGSSCSRGCRRAAGRWPRRPITASSTASGTVDVSNALLDPGRRTPRRAAARPPPETPWRRTTVPDGCEDLAAMPIAATGAAVDAVRHPARHRCPTAREHDRGARARRARSRRPTRASTSA